MTVRRKADTIDKWVGLSSDVKPSVGVPDGSYFTEEDTDKLYISLQNNWIQFVSGGSIGIGGGNPFNEPLRVAVNGSKTAPAINIGSMDHPTGFYVKDSSLLYVTIGGGTGVAAFDPGGISFGAGYTLSWLDDADIDNWLISSYAGQIAFDPTGKLVVFTLLAPAVDVALASTHSLRVLINGVNYKIPLTTV